MLALTDKKEIIHIKDALTKTDYYCAKCDGRLRVRNGKIKVKHFYHLGTDCGSKGESLIHKYWKNYFLNLKEFEGYNIVESREEVSLLKGTYIPDVVMKTDKNTYIIIEIFYKNPKDCSYFEKFKKLKRLEKVYEIEVDFNEIISQKKLYDIEEIKEKERKRKELLEEVERKRRYIINKYSKKGGLVFDYNILKLSSATFVLYKDLKPKYNYAYNKFARVWYRYPISSSLLYKKYKVHLLEKIRDMRARSKSFYINIYDYKNLKNYNWVEKFQIYTEEEDLEGDISIVIEDELENKK